MAHEPDGRVGRQDFDRDRTTELLPLARYTSPISPTPRTWEISYCPSWGYWVHPFEEHSLPVIGPDYSLPDMVRKAGARGDAIDATTGHNCAMNIRQNGMHHRLASATV
jgi:hypothetical protein